MKKQKKTGSRIEAYRMLIQAENKLRDMGFVEEADEMNDCVIDPMFGNMTNEEQDQINQEYEESIH